MSAALAEGPFWSDGETGRMAGRFPLSVESFPMARVAELLPGVTTVTPHAKYYALHSYIASELAGGKVDHDWIDFFRRCEVVVGAASTLHLQAEPLAHSGLAAPHGHDKIVAAIEAEGLVPVADLAGPRAYAQAKRGFLGPYLGSERAMGLVSDAGGGLQPGSWVAESGMPRLFAGLKDLALQDQVALADLESRSDLCVCGQGGRERPWLSQVFFPDLVDPASPAAKRRQTAIMLLRLVEMYSPDDVSRGLEQQLVADTWVRQDATLSGLDVVPAWRGVVLRRWFSGAWRDLWAWLVNEQLTSAVPTAVLREVLTDQLPNMTVREFLFDLPAAMEEGEPTSAEFHRDVGDLNAGSRSLARIMIGATRAGKLGEREAPYFENRALEARNRELTPHWMLNYLDERMSRSMKLVGPEIIDLVLRRAQRVAMAKASYKDGRLVIPSRVGVRDGVVFADSREGGGPVSLRWNQLAQVLCGLGYLERDDATWSVVNGVAIHG